MTYILLLAPDAAPEIRVFADAIKKRMSELDSQTELLKRETTELEQQNILLKRQFAKGHSANGDSPGI